MRFVSYIAEEKFMRSMVKLVTRAGKKGGRDNLEASDKVLDLLQSWGETFVNHPEKDQVRLFIAHYHELRLKGVRFPHESTTQSTGVMTPSKRPSQPNNQPTHQPTQQQQEGSGGSTANDAGSNKLQTVTGLSDEYTIVSSTLELISQALDHVTTPQELESNDIVIDLMAQINSVHGKIRSDLEAALLSNSPLLTGLLALNDNIHATLRRRENILTGQVVTGQMREHPEGKWEGEEEEEEGGSDGGSSSGEEDQQTEMTAPASLVVINSVVPTLSGPASGGRSRGRSGQSPSLKPADNNDLDDLLGLGLGMADQVPQSPQVPQSLPPPQPPLRQNSDGFGGLMRADSGWSEFSAEVGAGDTTIPMVASSVSSTTTATPPPSNGLGDLASLYSNSSQSNRNGMNGGMGNNRMQPGLVGLMSAPSHTNNNNMNNINGAGGSGGGGMMNGRMGNGGGMGNNTMQPGVMGLMSGPSHMNNNNGGGGMRMNGGGMHNNGMSGGMNNGMMMQQQTMGMIPTPTPTTPTPSTLQERPRSGSNPFDQFNPFAAVTNEASPQVEENKKRRPSNPFDNL